MLGALLGVGEELGLECEVLGRRGAARAGAGDRADGHGVALDPHQDLGAGADHLEAAEVEVEHVGAGVGAPQRAVEREGRQVEALRPALRGHDLEDVAGADVVLGPLDHLEVARVGGVRHRLAGREVAEVAAGLGGRAVEVAHRVHHPLGGLGVGGARVEAGAGPGRAHHRHLALDPVHHQHDRGPQHQRVGQAERVGVDVGQMLDQPHHVVAEIAEEPRGHRRQFGRQVDPALGDERAQARQRVGRLVLPAVGVEAGGAVEPRRGAAAFPDEVGLHAHEGIAPAHLAAGDAFEEKAVLARLGELQHQRDRRVEVGDEPGPDHLVPARGEGRGEVFDGGEELHPRRQGNRASVDSTSGWFTVTPAWSRSAAV